MRASCWFLCLKKSAITFGEGCTNSIRLWHLIMLCLDTYVFTMIYMQFYYVLCQKRQTGTVKFITISPFLKLKFIQIVELTLRAVLDCMQNSDHMVQCFVRNFLEIPHKIAHPYIKRCVFLLTLQWRHNDHDGVSNHQPHGCLPNRLFRRRSKKTSKLHATGLCVGNTPGPVNSPHIGPVTRKMFPFDDVIMRSENLRGPGFTSS